MRRQRSFSTKSDTSRAQAYTLLTLTWLRNELAVAILYDLACVAPAESSDTGAPAVNPAAVVVVVLGLVAERSSGWLD